MPLYNDAVVVQVPHFFAYATSTVSYTTTKAQTAWDVTVHNHPSGYFSYSSITKGITILVGGEYEVTVDMIQMRSSGNSAVCARFWCELDGTEVAGTRTLVACSDALAQVGSSHSIQTISAGQVLTVCNVRESGTVGLSAQPNSRILISKVLYA